MCVCEVLLFIQYQCFLTGLCPGGAEVRREQDKHFKHVAWHLACVFACVFWGFLQTLRLGLTLMPVFLENVLMTQTALVPLLEAEPL